MGFNSGFKGLKLFWFKQEDKIATRKLHLTERNENKAGQQK